MEKDNHFGTQANGVNEDKQGGLLKKDAQHCVKKTTNLHSQEHGSYDDQSQYQ